MIARRISLFTGLYLFCFLFAHLVNLSLGLYSLEFMDQASSWIIAPWSNPIGGGLLGMCLLFHIGLGLRALYLRNTLRLSQFDAFQLLLGLSIPVLLFPHIITMVMVEQDLGYQQVLSLFWIQQPVLGLRQVAGLMVVWLHSCMGLFIWMRLQTWWGKVSLFVYPTVVLLPTLAMLGFVEAGKEVIAAAQSSPAAYQSSSLNNDSDGAYGSATVKPNNNSGPAATGYGEDISGDYSNGANRANSSNIGSNTVARVSANPESSDTDTSLQFIGHVVQMAITGYLILIGLVLVARAWRLYPQRQQARVRIGDSVEVTIGSGASLLEISRLYDIAHASLCGGKGRCGTCQVAIVAGSENLTAPTAVEAQKLKQINAASNIRLACQARVSGGAVKAEPVLPAYVVASDMPHRRTAASAATSNVIAETTASPATADTLTSAGDES